MEYAAKKSASAEYHQPEILNINICINIANKSLFNQNKMQELIALKMYGNILCLSLTVENVNCILLALKYYFSRLLYIIIW